MTAMCGAGGRPIAASRGVEGILDLVQRRRGLDFRTYRPAMIERRIASRMLSAHTVSHAKYLQLLQDDPDEVDRLIACLTIKVSRFFRNAAVFNLLRDIVLPDRVRRLSGRPLRLWSAGCGNGEEAYSLAIMLQETGGACRDSIIYATDIDPAALRAASAAHYPEAALAEVPAALISRYFYPLPAPNKPSQRARPQYGVRDALGPRLAFMHHDLATADASPDGARFDLICCRNVLIYFQRQYQEHIQRLLRDSLAPGGYLCLGEAESLVPAVEAAFEVVDRKARLFRLQ